MTIGSRTRPIHRYRPARLTKAHALILITMMASFLAQSSSSQDKDQLASRRQSFASCRTLLIQHGVPFDPDELLRDDWPKRLRSVLDSMPEMKQVRRVTGPMHGVYIADTLYLPEHTSLAGNTVIIARYLVYEGSHPDITGPYDSATFTLKPRAVLGTTLGEVLRQNANQPEIQESAGSLPSFEIAKKFVKIEPHTIGANVSGSQGKKGADGEKGTNGSKGVDVTQSF